MVFERYEDVLDIVQEGFCFLKSDIVCCEFIVVWFKVCYYIFRDYENVIKMLIGVIILLGNYFVILFVLLDFRSLLFKVMIEESMVLFFICIVEEFE